MAWLLGWVAVHFLETKQRRRALSVPQDNMPLRVYCTSTEVVIL